MTVHFDTLEFVKTLTSAGVSASHAEAMMRAHARSLDEVVTSEIARRTHCEARKPETAKVSSALVSKIEVEFRFLRIELALATVFLSLLVVLMELV